MIARFAMACDSDVKSLTLNLGRGVGEGVGGVLGLAVGQGEGRGVGEGVGGSLGLTVGRAGGGREGAAGVVNVQVLSLSRWGGVVGEVAAGAVCF